MEQLEKPSNISISYSSPGFFTILFNNINNAVKYTLYYTNIHTSITNTIESIQPFIKLQIPYDSYTFQLECADIYNNTSYSDIINYITPHIHNITFSENDTESSEIIKKIYISWDITNSIDVIGYNIYNNSKRLDDIIYLSDTSVAIYVDKHKEYNISITAITEIGETAAVAVVTVVAASATAVTATLHPSWLPAEMLSPVSQQSTTARSILLLPPEPPTITFKIYDKSIDIFIENYNTEYIYSIYQYNPTTSNFFEVTTTRKNNRFRITGLSNGINYNFRIYSVLSDTLSTPVDINTIPQTIPQPPQIQHVQLGDSSIQVNWISPTDNGGSSILYYICQIYTASYSISLITDNSREFYKLNESYILHRGSLPSIIPYISIDYTFNSMNIYGLENNKTYTIQILASNIIGSSSPSSQILATPMSVPQAPSNISVIGIFEGVTVRWSYNINIIPPLIGFKVFWKLETSTNEYDGMYYITNPNITSYTISGLINDSRYIVYIKAINDYGDSFPSPYKIGIPYNTESELLIETISADIPDITVIYNNPLITFDYARNYLDKIQRRETNYSSIVYKQADSIFSILNTIDISLQKNIFIDRVLFKSRDNIIWLYNITHPSYRDIKTSVCIMTTTQNKKYSNARLPRGLNIIDINQFDESEIMIVGNIFDTSTYTTLEFEINRTITGLYIYKEIGDTISLLVSSLTSNTDMKTHTGTTYNNITLQYIGQNNGRYKFIYYGPISRLIFSYSVLTL